MQVYDAYTESRHILVNPTRNSSMGLYSRRCFAASGYYGWVGNGPKRSYLNQRQALLCLQPVSASLQEVYAIRTSDVANKIWSRVCVESRLPVARPTVVVVVIICPDEFTSMSAMECGVIHGRSVPGSPVSGLVDAVLGGMRVAAAYVNSDQPVDGGKPSQD